MIELIEVEESLNVQIETMEKGTNTYPIDITNHKYSKSIEVGVFSIVNVQMMENPSISTNKHLIINKAM